MRRIAMLGGLLLLATLLVAACGDDDDDDDDDGSPTATATTPSDDGGGDDSDDSGDDPDDSDDDDNSPPAVQGGGDFEDYAANLCTALDDFVDTLPNLLNQQQFAAGNFQSLAEPYADLADRLEDARPPDALDEYHSALVSVIRGLADAFDEGGADAFARLENLADFPMPSDAELEAFASAGADVPECRDIGFVDG